MCLFGQHFSRRFFPYQGHSEGYSHGTTPAGIFPHHLEAIHSYFTFCRIDDGDFFLYDLLMPHWRLCLETDKLSEYKYMFKYNV